MRTKITSYVNKDRELLLNEGVELAKITKDQKYKIKINAINLYLSGIKVPEISKSLGYSIPAIYKWIRKVLNSDFENLQPKKHPGKKSKLSNKIKDEIKRTIKENKPEEYGYYIWNGPNLSDFILKKYNINYGVRDCQRLFHKLGFSLIRPRTFPNKGENNLETREDYKKKF